MPRDFTTEAQARQAFVRCRSVNAQRFFIASKREHPPTDYIDKAARCGRWEAQPSVFSTPWDITMV